MATLQNPRHELFAQGVVEGKSADASYTDAGYKSQRQNASRLMANDDVKQRVAELQDHHQQRPDITVDGLTTQLEPSGRKAGVWDRLMDAITEAYDGDVQMIDSSSVRVHQHAGCAKKRWSSLYGP